jgi:hypothetical protein
MGEIPVKVKKESTFTLSQIKEKYFPQWDLETLNSKIASSLQVDSSQNLLRKSSKNTTATTR